MVNVSRSALAEGVSLDDAWRAVSDTNTLNRAAGMATVHFEPVAGRSAARMIGRTRLAGMDVRYEELPFEWEQRKRLVSRRIMLEGPLKSLETTFAIEPADGGVRVTVSLAIELRWKFLTPILRLQAGSSADTLVATILRLSRHTVGPHSPTQTDPLARAAERLASDPDAVHAARLVEHVRTADDFALARLRPYVLADAWGVDRTELLVTCLAAVPAGLLDLRWEVVCPGCVNPVERYPTLSDLGAEGRCHVCDLAFLLDFDRAVEATFTPSPAVREVAATQWCSGGPARYPHAYAQSLLPSLGKARLAIPDAAGRYRLFVRGQPMQEVDVAADAPASTSVDALLGSVLQAEVRAALRVAPGGELLVENADQDRDLHARLDCVPSRDDAASARDVTSLQAFRTRFSSETLRPGVALHVQRVALLFSDLAASTELYARLGDAAAYRLVSDHFEMMRAAIVRQGGTVVKTIGDAVMAAFRDEDAAMAAALHALAAMEAFRARNDDNAATHVKLGVHVGPCFAICANGITDYFGQTVNVAARLQALAAPAEVAASTALVERAAPPDGWTLDRGPEEEVRLRGVAGPMQVRRARLVRAR